MSGSISSRMRFSSMPRGSGNWTMYPVQAGSSFSSRTTASISSCVAVAGSSRWMEAMPTWAQSRCLPATYFWLPGSSPTRTVPRPGVTPLSFSAATRAVSSDLIAAAVALPSRIWAVMPPSSRMTGPRFQSGRCAGTAREAFGRRRTRPPLSARDRRCCTCTTHCGRAGQVRVRSRTIGAAQCRGAVPGGRTAYEETSSESRHASSPHLTATEEDPP